MTNLLRLNLQHSGIKGYHHFKIKPSKNVSLQVDLEYTNVHDVNAALVWVPSLNELPTELHNATSDPARHLKVSDIGGLPVGHVPRGLAGTFRTIIESGGSISAIVTGKPCQSFPPWPVAHAVGGGAVIPCDYMIETRNQDL